MSRNRPEEFNEKEYQDKNINSKFKKMFNWETFFWIVFTSMIVWFLVPALPLLGEEKTRYEDIKEIKSMDVKLTCLPQNTVLITEDSELICEVSMRSSHFNYTISDILITLVDNRNLYTIIWGCQAKLFDITAKKFSSPTICLNELYNNTFLPRNVGSYSFKIDYIVAQSSVEGAYLEFTGKPDNFLPKSLDIVSRSQEINLQVSKRGVIIALTVGILAYFSIIYSRIQLRKQLTHSEEQQKEQFEFQKTVHSKEQQSLLKSLFGELLDVKEDSDSYESVLKETPLEFPLYQIKEIDASFYSKNLDSTINGKDTFVLKRKLFKTSDKIKLINYYLRWLHTAEFDPTYHSMIEKDTNKKFRNIIFENLFPRLLPTKAELDKYLSEVLNILETDFCLKQTQ